MSFGGSFILCSSDTEQSLLGIVRLRSRLSATQETAQTAEEEHSRQAHQDLQRKDEKNPIQDRSGCRIRHSNWHKQNIPDVRQCRKQNQTNPGDNPKLYLSRPQKAQETSRQTTVSLVQILTM